MQKCSENYNEGVVKKVSNIPDTNDYPKSSTLLQGKFTSPCISPNFHNYNDYDSNSDSNEKNDSEDKNYSTEKNIN